MRDETEIEQMRARIAQQLEAVDGTGPNEQYWQKLEAAEVALDWALGDTDALGTVLALTPTEHTVDANDA